MMKSKGFTLIELLAVIVILAIIALIATPIVLGIIDESRENTDKVTAQYIVDMVEKAYSIAYTNNMGVTPTLGGENGVQGAFKMNGATWEVRSGVHTIVTPNDAVKCTAEEIADGEDKGKIKFVCNKNNTDNQPIESGALDVAKETTQTGGAAQS